MNQHIPKVCLPSVPAGAITMAVTYMDGEGVVLCHLPDNTLTPWVTWRYYLANTGVSYGRYHVREQAARECFEERSKACMSRWVAYA